MNTNAPALPTGSTLCRRSLRCFALLCLLTLAGLGSAARAAEGGMITGSVSNTATNDLLKGATIELPQLNLSALTDNAGRFVLRDVPVGTHEVTASYMGLDAVHQQVTVTAGGRTVLEFTLTGKVYKMEEFRVTGQREGEAASLVARRNAPNAKNVITTESVTNVPNMGVGELAVRLPGVTAGGYDDAGNVTGFTVRGTSGSLNQITLDGNLMPGTGGFGRGFRVDYTNAAMFEQVEVIKGHTPDKPADSLGGTVNLISRSPLNMKEKRRLTYRVAGRLAPTFTQQTPLSDEHPFHQLLSFGYQEVFGVLGGDRNLGVSVNAFYSENVNGGFNSIRDFETTTSQPAYVWDYRTTDTQINKMQSSVTAKAEFQLSPNTKFTLNTMYNLANHPLNQRYETAATTTQSVGTTGTAGILPGYTDRITNVRAAPGSTITMTSSRTKFVTRLRHVDFGAVHQIGPLTLDTNLVYSRNTVVSPLLRLGNQIANVGWTLDRTQSDLYPRFIQTEGLDFTNPANYRPVTNNLLLNHEYRYSATYDLRANALYKLPTTAPMSLKAGVSKRSQKLRTYEHDRRWNYIGTTAVPSDPSLITFDSQMTGRRIPQWEVASFFDRNESLVNPTLWREDIYFSESTKFTNTKRGREDVSVAYVMAQGKLSDHGLLSHTGYLGGVRMENTETNGAGYVRSHTPSTAAEQQADGVAAAAKDYASTGRFVSGDYTKSFPSFHLTHDITKNLKALASWSNSFGRPAMTNFLPNESYNDTTRTLTLPNPSLKPQVSKNWDLSLDYYFEPVGTVSVSWFKKSIRDYILTGIQSGTVPTGNTNGFNGEYAGYTIFTSANAGTSEIKGWEFGYQQQFTFLPSFLSGLGVAANYSIIDTHGDFGTTTLRTTGQVPGFIPRTGSLILSWHYRAFSAQGSVVYQSDYITSYSATSPSRNRFRYERKYYDFGVAYELRPGVTFTIDVSNPTNEPQAFYLGYADRLAEQTIPGTTITFGVGGRF